MKKKLLIYITFYILIAFATVYYTYSEYNKIKPIEISHQLEYLPTSDVSLPTMELEAQSVELSLDQFKKLSFEGATYIVLTRHFHIVEVSATVMNTDGVNFNTVIDEIEIPTVIIGIFDFANYKIIKEEISGDTVILNFIPGDGLFLMFNILIVVLEGLILALIFIASTYKFVFKSNLKAPPRADP